jgi:hypothetical protein
MAALSGLRTNRRRPLVLLGAAFLAVQRILGFAREVEFLFALGDEGPVRVVDADSGIDLEPGRQFDKEFDILVAV